jgi:hypothetical protein
MNRDLPRFRNTTKSVLQGGGTPEPGSGQEPCANQLIEPTVQAHRFRHDCYCYDFVRLTEAIRRRHGDYEQRDE